MFNTLHFWLILNKLLSYFKVNWLCCYKAFKNTN